MKPPPFDLQNALLDQGTVVLEASAGTGKTYTLVGILLRLLLERAIDRLDEALVVTFTNAATQELKNRLRQGLADTLAAARGKPGDDPLFHWLGRKPDAERLVREALDGFDEVSVATIHGFCKRVLDEAAFESREPFQKEFAADTLPWLYRAAQDSLRAFYTAAATAQSTLLARERITPEQLVKWYRLWRRYPDVRLQPDQPAAAAPLALLEAAVPAAAALLDDDLLEQLVNLAWYAGKSPFPAPVEDSVQRFRERVRTRPGLVVPTLRSFAPTVLKTLLKKNGMPACKEPFFAACDAVRAAYDEAQAHLRVTLLHTMDARLEQQKRTDHVLSYDDLLVRTHRALRDPERGGALCSAIRDRYKVALIDEFQDTDSLQYEIFARCFRNRPLFLIGDPKQAIYGFRGADLRTYLAARDDAAERATLARNFRSSDPLVRAVSLLFAREQAFVDERITAPPLTAKAGKGELLVHGDGEPVPRWRVLPTCAQLANKDETEDRIARDVAAEISRLLRGSIMLDARRLLPRDIAVLTRSNRQALAVQNELRDAGIVSAIGNAGDIWLTEEVQDLERLLLAVLQPGDLMRARAALATRLWGKSAHDLALLRDDEALLDTHLERLAEWRRTWLRHGFVVMHEQIQNELGVPERLLGFLGGERRLTNLRQLVELLHDAELEHHLTPEGLLEWLRHERAHQDEIDVQLRELRLESDEDAVQIRTVHVSKGLQYEVVFCPFLWNAIPPSGAAVVPAADGRELAWKLTKQDPRWHAAEEERLAEDVRLCYVALTRARRRCYVHWPATGIGDTGSWRSALAWILTPAPPSRQRAGAPDPQWVENWATGIKHDLPQFGRMVRAFVASSEGTMDVTEVEPDPKPEPCPPSPTRPLGAARTPARDVYARAMHSFSSLCAGAEPAEGRELDEPVRTVAAAAAQPAGIFAFARGAAAGTCLHTILEHAHLGAIDATTERLVRDTLAGSGLAEAGAHAAKLDPTAAVLQNLRDLAAATLHAGGPTFAALTTGSRAAEWQFVLPASHAPLARLADVFAAGPSVVARGYAERLRLLPSRTLRGFLTGFVDLLAGHDGRHYVLDWKSNWLGDATADYGTVALARAMHEHDYVLQYHLYVLALHRQLRARLPSYDPERHLGGVGYVFLRGAVPATSNGVFFDRVPAAMVVAMDRWLSGGMR